MKNSLNNFFIFNLIFTFSPIFSGKNMPTLSKEEKKNKEESHITKLQKILLGLKGDRAIIKNMNNELINKCILNLQKRLCSAENCTISPQNGLEFCYKHRAKRRPKSTNQISSKKNTFSNNLKFGANTNRTNGSINSENSNINRSINYDISCFINNNNNNDDDY